MRQPSHATDSMRQCPECAYTLVGLRELVCPECGRQTSEAELVRLARSREMPPTLAQIALFGVVFTVILSCWSLASLLVSITSDGRHAAMYAIGLVVSLMAIGPGLWVRRRIRIIHERSEIWAWIAAHGAWLGVVGAVICIA